MARIVATSFRKSAEASAPGWSRDNPCCARRAPPASRHGTHSNRIGDARFEWDRRHIELARNFPPEPHAIHGVGFERVWSCSARTADSVLLTLVHQPDGGWPWAFEARQRITIAPRELTLDLTAVNLAPRPVPLSFGHHPYFPQSGACLAFRARGVWLVGEDGLPNERVKPSGKFDFSTAMPVDHCEVDHCFTGWTGPARIAWSGKPLELEVSGSWTLPSAGCAFETARTDSVSSRFRTSTIL
jgi:aldose 1-epimerase